MNKLSLALIIIISIHALIGMEVEETKPSPITLAQTYYYFAHVLLMPEIAQKICLLQLDSVNFKKLSDEIEQSCKDAESLVKYINTLIKYSWDSLLANELCVQLFPYAKISICDIKTTCKTSLHYAVEQNYPTVTLILLKIANDKKWMFLTTTDDNDDTALLYAASDAKTKSIKILLNAAGDNAQTLVTMQNKGGRTALHRATLNENIKDIPLLLDAAGDKAQTLLTMQTNDGLTALHYAIYINNTEIVKLLLNVSGNQTRTLLSMRDFCGATALHYAAYRYNTEIIELLLIAAGDNTQTLLSIKNNDNKTAFDVANSETKKFIQKYMTINQ